MFKSVLTLLKQTGKSNVQHKDIISEADLQKLSSSDTLSVHSPQGLQFKVFLDIMFYTCRRGRENLRKMKKTDFKVKTDGQGRRFYQNSVNYQTKNHRGADLNDEDVDLARIYEIPGDAKCPVLALEKYLSKLNPNNDSFWQRPRDSVTETDMVWYRNASVGHNTLGNFMKIISEKADLSQLYTNHCIRATCITALDDSGVEARHIMSISGHKSETSIKSYSRNVSENKKHEMYAVLQKSLHTVAGNADNSNEIVGQVNKQTCETEDTTSAVPLENLVFDPNQMKEVSESDFLTDILDQTAAISNVDQNKENMCNLVNTSTSVKNIRNGMNGPYFHNVHEVHFHYHN